jgi:tRNA A37 methylthiotransferase MiaB
MNMADSERMAGQLESLGFREAKTDKEVKQAKVRGFTQST